jgi:trypsin
MRTSAAAIRYFLVFSCVAAICHARLKVSVRTAAASAHPENQEPSSFHSQTLRQLSTATNTTKRQHIYESNSASNPNYIEPQIIGGSAVTSASTYPYFVSVGAGAMDLCGGSLVAPNVFLTAAHCAGGAYSAGMTAIIGAYHFETPGYVVTITTTHQAPQYTEFHNDIMLVGFTPPISSSVIRPVTLNFNTAVPAEATTLTVMGLGATTDAYGYAQTLQSASVRIVPFDECQHTYYPFLVPGEHICVEGTSPLRVTCAGDSGGPLMSGDLQVGVLSFGTTTCTDGPSVFTRTSHYMPWLTEALCVMTHREMYSAHCT